MNRLPWANPAWPWILANAVAIMIGGAVAAIMVLSVEEPLEYAGLSQQSAAAALGPGTAASLGVFGAVVGLAQWLVLRRTWSANAWWVVATVVGWAAAGAIAGILSGFLSGTVTGVGPGIGLIGYVVGTAVSVAAIGLLPGLLQSLVLRPRLEARAWSTAHLVALVAGIVVAFPVMLAVAAMFRLNLPSPGAWIPAGLLAGTVFGFLTLRVLGSARP